MNCTSFVPETMTKKAVVPNILELRLIEYNKPIHFKSIEDGIDGLLKREIKSVSSVDA